MPNEHETGKDDKIQLLQAGAEALVVTVQPTKAAEPSKVTPHDPAARKTKPGWPSGFLITYRALPCTADVYSASPLCILGRRSPPARIGWSLPAPGGTTRRPARALARWLA